MRRDARKLLEKLNRADFAYREFEDSFSETELWPIFAAVLGDQSVVGDDAAPQSSRGIPPIKAAAAPSKPQEPASPPNPIFGSYGMAPVRGSEKKPVDLQEFFSRFSELD
ncbi:hypothetical protein [Sphingobium sp. Sx8-8]|uniref:hypothetical protein n=1 Tax=Sphingobium sp. Sx8-8 TaxID=2933617 RepID=UPI001F5A93F5|nr:hypothetical protein [Sphingobium sp. Sx8-8]